MDTYMNRIILYVLSVLLSVTPLFAADPPVTIHIDGQEVHKGERELPVSAKGVSAMVPGPIIAEPIHEPEMNDEQKRIKEVQPSTFTKQTDGYLLRVDIGAKNFGKVEIKSLAEGEEVAKSEAKAKISQFLNENAAIVGRAGEYEYIVNYVTRHSIKFHQIVDGMEMPDSLITIGNAHEVASLQLVVTEPGNPILDRSTWLTEEELELQAITLIDSELGGFDKRKSLERSVYRLIEHTVEEESKGNELVVELIPLYETFYAGYRIQLNALTGELFGFGTDAVNALDECDKFNPTNFGHTACDSVTPGGILIFKHFRTNNSCLNQSTLCSNPQINAVQQGVLNTGISLHLAGYPGPSDLDILYHARDPYTGAVLAAGIQFNAGQGPAISIGDPVLNSVAANANEMRQDIGGHELVHAWHAVYNYSVRNSTLFFAKAFRESVADLLRAITSGEFTTQLPGVAPRVLDNSTTWNSWNTSDEYIASLVLSNFFLEINKSIGGGMSGKGTKLLINMIENGNAGTSIENLRLALRSYIYGTNLTIAERASVCNIWTSLSMPGVLCDPPSRPASFSAVNTGICSYYGPGLSYFGSVFRLYWSNVDREDYFEVMDSLNPWIGYVPKITFQKDVTQSFPLLYFVDGLFYVAVRACNESGCSGLSGAPAQNTCFFNE